MIRTILIISGAFFANVSIGKEIKDISELTKRLDNGVPQI